MPGRLVRAALSITVAVAGLVALPASTSTAATAWKPRPEQYPATTIERDLAIPMSDGTVLRGNLVRPVGADGKVVTTKLPTIVTITAYNKNVQDQAGGLAGGDSSYLVKRGYLQLTVDARGTGSSEGTWCAFCTREDKDFGEVVTWAGKQPWSDGTTGMSGPSYMGIAQIFAAGAKPQGLKAIFPQVPGADVYRDVVASGGALDVGFIPLWIGLVNGTAIIPPTLTASNPALGLGTLVTHLLGNGAFSANLLLTALGGGEPAYDGDFYTQRSPINVASKIDVPTFFVSGEYDLFQRGTPLLYENLRKRGVQTKMIVGPWDHLQASGGVDLEKAGYGTLNELQLRWFDRYVKGRPDPTLDSDIPPLTYFQQGTGAWTKGTDVVAPGSRATSFKLSGAATTGQTAALTTGKTTDGVSNVLPIPAQGLCTRSTNQWTAGILNKALPDLPCFTNNQYNDALGPVFDTAPLTKAVTIQGQVNARLYTSTVGAGDGMLSVALEDVAPDGTVSRLTGGWQVISMRALDTKKSRYLDGKLIQPFHPFTKPSKKALAAGEVAPVDVEIFPTAAKILPGHKLRLAVQAFDVPHLLPTLGDLLGSLSVIQVHSSAKYPSEVTLPTR